MRQTIGRQPSSMLRLDEQNLLSTFHSTQGLGSAAADPRNQRAAAFSGGTFFETNL